MTTLVVSPEEKALQSLLGYFYPDYVIGGDGTNLFFNGAQSVTVEPFTYGVTIAGTTVLGDVNFERFADAATVDINAVFGDIILDDAWYGDFQIGLIGGTFNAVDSRGGDIDAGIALGGFDFEQSDGWQITVDYAGSSSFVASSFNNVDVGFATGHWSIGGNGNVFDFGWGPATVLITGDDTVLDLGDGDSFVFDLGDDTQARLGGGNDTFFAQGEGLTLVNGEGGRDTFFDFTSGDVVAKGFETVFIENLEGSTVLLDTPMSGSIDIGGVPVSLHAAMEIFGDADGADAVLDFNDRGDLTVVNAAQDYGLADDWLMVA